MKNLSKKQTLITAGLSAFGLTTIIVSAYYIYSLYWEPFKEINWTKNSRGTGIVINVKSKVPIKGFVEYGTNPSAMLKAKDEIKDFTTQETIKIAYVLPEKEHFIRITATTEEGDEFKSRLIKVD